MKIFGQIIRTAVNIVTLPVAVAQDTVRLFADPTRLIDDGDSAIADKLRQLKDEAGEEE